MVVNPYCPFGELNSGLFGNLPASPQVGEFEGFIREGVQHVLSSNWEEAFSSLDKSIEAIFATPTMANQLPIKQLLKQMVDVGSKVSMMTEEEFVAIGVVLHPDTSYSFAPEHGLLKSDVVGEQLFQQSPSEQVPKERKSNLGLPRFEELVDDSSQGIPQLQSSQN